MRQQEDIDATLQQLLSAAMSFHESISKVEPVAHVECVGYVDGD
tara:strand:- start:740 stop:871 length:132 start_codon:yes stop_codon:yes gene_type:complete